LTALCLVFILRFDVSAGMSTLGFQNALLYTRARRL